MRVHPVVSEASVVKRTRPIAIFSASSASAQETEAASRVAIQAIVLFMVILCPLLIGDRAQALTARWAKPEQSAFMLQYCALHLD